MRSRHGALLHDQARISWRRPAASQSVPIVDCALRGSRYSTCALVHVTRRKALGSLARPAPVNERLSGTGTLVESCDPWQHRGGRVGAVVGCGRGSGGHVAGRRGGLRHPASSASVGPGVRAPAPPPGPAPLLAGLAVRRTQIPPVPDPAGCGELPAPTLTSRSQGRPVAARHLDALGSGRGASSHRESSADLYRPVSIDRASAIAASVWRHALSSRSPSEPRSSSARNSVANSKS